MNSDFQDRKGEILFNAIGEIDDRFIYEAENPSAVSNKNAFFFKRIAVVCSVTVVIASLLLTVFVGTMLANEKNEASDGQNGILSGDSLPSHSDKSTSLGISLLNVKKKTQSLSAPLRREMLFDGKTRLIWKYRGEDAYRVCSVDSTADIGKIRAELAEKRGFTPATESSVAEGIDGMWICFGDGLVYTPYLLSSNGNIGFGDVFDYEPELEPSDEFTALIMSVIQNSN